jgi:hypothetical protein
MGDLYEPKYAAYALGIWGVGCVAGPVLGPLLGVSWNLDSHLSSRESCLSSSCILPGLHLFCPRLDLGTFTFLGCFPRVPLISQIFMLLFSRSSP